MTDVALLGKKAVVSSYYQFASVAALRASSLPNIVRATIDSYYGDGKFGGGDVIVYPSDTTTADDNGSVFVDQLGRRWYRADQKRMTPCQFGAKPDDVYGNNNSDNGPILTALFFWTLVGNCGRIADLEHYTYGVRTTPVLGDPAAATAIGYAQANPFTITATLPYTCAGRYGARIMYYPTHIGQYLDGLYVYGTQALAYLTMENFVIYSNEIDCQIATQTPINNTIVITGANAAGFVTASPVRVRGGSSADLTTLRSYWLIKQPGVDTYSFARNPLEAAAGTAIAMTNQWPANCSIRAVEGGVINGFSTYGTHFTSSTYRNLGTVNVDNGFVLDNIEGGNGEFCHYEKCGAGSCKRFYWQKSNSGQAYRPTFKDCGASPRWEDGVCVFESGGGDVGYGFDSYSMNGSVLYPQDSDPANYGNWRNPIYYLIERGGYEPINNYGGRMENLTGFIKFAPPAGGHPFARVNFKGMTFTGLAPTVEDPFIVSTSGYAGAIVRCEECGFDINAGSVPDKYHFNIGSINQTGYNSPNSVIFDYCLFSGDPVWTLESGSNDGYIEFNSCHRYTTLGFIKIQSRVGHAKGSFPVLDKTGHDTIANYTGIPDNQIVYPDFGPVYGTSLITPTAPWTVSGNLVHPGKIEAIWFPGDYSTPSSRVVQFQNGAMLSQVLGGATPIVPTAAVPFFYVAEASIDFVSNGNDYFGFSLTNSVTGKVYAKFILKAGSNLPTHQAYPIVLMAYPVSTESQGFYQLNIWAISPNAPDMSLPNTMKLRIGWQLASSNRQAAYVLPKPGQTETQVTTYGSNIDTLRAVSKLTIPYKADAFGSGLSGMSAQDLRSDMYVSSDTEQLMYCAGSRETAGLKWWTVQRVTKATSMPTSGSWKVTDFVMNANMVVLGSAGSKYVIEGWLRITTGNGNVLNTDWIEKHILTGT